MLDFALDSGRALRSCALAAMLSMGIAGCNTSDDDSGEPTPEPTTTATPSTGPTATPTVPPTATPASTATPQPGSPTPTPTATATPTGTASPSATPTASPSATPTAPPVAPAATPFPAPALSFVPPGQSLDLPNYTLVAQYDLPIGTSPNLLASETSAVTYNRDSGTLFIIGDHGTSVVEFSKTGTLLGSMTFGTALADPEGIAWVDNNQFVIAQERIRTLSRFSYANGTTLAAGAISSVKIGTTIDNIGLEGISYDPITSGFVLVKEKDPLGLLQTNVDFGAGTATNGSPTTVNSANLFNPSLAGFTDFSDIYALSNTLAPAAGDYGDLLVLGQENGLLRKMDRSGNVRSTLNVGIPAQHEGVAADENNVIYLSSELGGGAGRPQLWVYQPTTSPTAVGVGSRLFLTFAVNVVAGNGNFAINNGAGDTRSIAIGDTSQVSFNGRTVTVDLASDLIPGTTYNVTGPAGLIRASDSGAFSTAISASFATRADTLPPRLLSTTPLDNAVGVISNRVVLAFNEAVRAGTGNIVISDGASNTRTIAVGDSTQVTITGSTVEVVPTVPLTSSTNYNVQLAAGVIEDVYGNDYAGLTSADAFNFRTAKIGGGPPTTLEAGQILFMGINGDPTDAIAFVTLVNLGAGTQIQFTDKNYDADGPVVWPNDEAAFTWTADDDYPAGTIVTIQTDNPFVSDLGSVTGVSGGVGTGSETYYAFQGTINNAATGDIDVARFLALIYIGTGLSGDYPSEITGADSDIYLGTDDNWKYNGSLDRSNLPAFADLVRDTGNWVSDNNAGYPLPNGSMFGAPLPPTGTELNVGDLLFMGANADATDAISFVLLKAVARTTTIQFTDKDYSAAGAGSFGSGESAFTWTADVDYPAGTIVTIQPDNAVPIADLGQVSGVGGGIGASGETYYAFQGTITNAATSDITVARFLASLNVGGLADGDIPASINTTDASFTFTQNNVKYTASLDRQNLTTFAARVRDTSTNWQKQDSPSFPITAGHMFGGSDLAVGGVLFAAASSDNGAGGGDTIAFVLTQAIMAGTEISFADKNYIASSSTFAAGEAAFTWTADTAYPAGTVVTIQANTNPFVADKGSLYGARGGLSDDGETYYAFKGQMINPATNALIVERFLAAIRVGSNITATGDIPVSLIGPDPLADAFVDFNEDNAKFNQAINASDFAPLRNEANWQKTDAAAFPLTGSSLVFP